MLHPAREALKNYLDEHLIHSHANDCTLITGTWGTGKSHFIHEYIKNLPEKQNKKRMTIYISLFKIQSIQALQTELMLKYYRWMKPVGFFIKALNEIKSIIPFGSYIPINSLFSLLDEKDLKNAIIIFDDFERLSPNIDLHNILGHISELKEVKKCKVVIIANELITTIQSSHPLADEKEKEQPKKTDIFLNKETWCSFKEKIVDNYFIFNPSPVECINILLNSNEFKLLSNKSIANTIHDIAKAESLTNMRILQRILNNMKKLHVITKFPQSKITKQSIEFIVEKTIEHNKHQTNRTQFYARNEAAEEAPDVNRMILDFIFSGHINIDLFNKVFVEYTKQSLLDDSIHASITKFYQTTEASKEQTTTEIIKAINSNAKDLKYGTIIRVLVFFIRTDKDLFDKYSYLFTDKITTRIQSYKNNQSLYSEIRETFYDIEHISQLKELAYAALSKENRTGKDIMINNDEAIQKQLSAKNISFISKETIDDIPDDRLRDIIERRIINLHDIATILNYCSDKKQEVIAQTLLSLQDEPFLKTKLHACGLEQHLLEQFFGGDA